jgi:hypothetical protein
MHVTRIFRNGLVESKECLWLVIKTASCQNSPRIILTLGYWPYLPECAWKSIRNLVQPTTDSPQLKTYGWHNILWSVLLFRKHWYIEIIHTRPKVVISYNPASKLALFQTCAFLPEVQLSIFIRLIQIVFEYMHPIVSGI